MVRVIVAGYFDNVSDFMTTLVSPYVVLRKYRNFSGK